MSKTKHRYRHTQKRALTKKHKKKHTSSSYKKSYRVVGIVPALTDKQKQIICKSVPTQFNGFEEEVERLFKRNHLDITSATYNLEKQIIKDIRKAVSPSNITPHDDFYSYINERWLRNMDVDAAQAYITQIDNFRLVQDKVYRELIEIIENYLKLPDRQIAHKRKHTLIKNAYESFQRLSSHSTTTKRASDMLQQIDALIGNGQNNDDGLWELLGVLNENEIISSSAPFVWTINPDEKNPQIYKCYLEPPSVSLIDAEVYFDDDTDTPKQRQYKKNVRETYAEYLDKLFENAFGTQHGFDVLNVYITERELLEAMICTAYPSTIKAHKNIDTDTNYHLITGKDARENYMFNWNAFSRHIGFSTPPRDFVTSNVNYLFCATQLMREKWRTPQWRTYWIYVYISSLCRFDELGWKHYFEFHGKFQRGQEQPVDATITPIFGMSFTFNTFLTNEYILRYKNDQSVQYVKHLVEDLRRVFVRIIKRNQWLQPKTRQTAIEKLEAVQLKVGSPAILREDPLLNYAPDDPWGNLEKMAKWRHQKAIELTGKGVVDIPVIDWTQIPPKMVSTQAYVVNAMYTPTENAIYIPLGYIQKPFVDLEERGIEYNLAHIGFTIAHEMSHALDDYGSQYDKDGVLRNWWTDKDRQRFHRIQKNIVDQYEAFARRDKITFDAWPSVGENLADISGFAICLEYLRDFQLKNQDILPIQTISFEAFFIYFALQSRQKIRERAILAQLKTNPHPLDKYRCNIPLSRSEVFRAIYKVSKKKKMWWRSVNMVWSN